jgi:PAS domain S-box-containing protein
MKSLQFQFVWKPFVLFLLAGGLSIASIKYIQDSISYLFLPFLTICVGLILYMMYRKIGVPLSQITANLKSALSYEWGNVKPVETYNPELMELNKYSQYLIEALHQKEGVENNFKAFEIKNETNKFQKSAAVSTAGKFKLAVDSSPDLVLIVDKFGYINYANRTVSNFTGLDFGSIENKKVTDLWHKEDDVNLWKTNYDKALKEGKSIGFSSWGVKAGGLKFEAAIQISPIKDDSGAIESFLVTERDVSEERQKERIKTEFMSVVSHELRTPMSVIRGYSSILSDEKLGTLNEKQKEYIDKINSETGRLLELANDMLDLQKFESGKIELKFEKTSVPKLIEKIVADFQSEYKKKGFTLTMQNNLQNEFADIDPKYFERVITNLLTNAYKYTEHGGVEIFLINPEPNNIVIAVKDTGVGIKEDALPHLFERFYQASNVMSRKQEGTGLGLSIVKTVTEAHGGMVWVESKVGVGSTFFIAVPAL